MWVAAFGVVVFVVCFAPVPLQIVDLSGATRLRRALTDTFNGSTSIVIRRRISGISVSTALSALRISARLCPFEEELHSVLAPQAAEGRGRRTENR